MWSHTTDCGEEPIQHRGLAGSWERGTGLGERRHILGKKSAGMSVGLTDMAAGVNQWVELGKMAGRQYRAYGKVEAHWVWSVDEISNA